MRKYLAVVTLATILLFALGCNRTPAGITASPGQQFELRLAETATVTSGDLKIKFADMLGDSRCPLNAVCIWAGEVACRLEITYGGNTFDKTLVKPGNSPEFATDEFAGHTLRFDVQPYPEAGKEVKKSDYVLRLIIDRGS